MFLTKPTIFDRIESTRSKSSKHKHAETRKTKVCLISYKIFTTRFEKGSIQILNNVLGFQRGKDTKHRKFKGWIPTCLLT